MGFLRRWLGFEQTSTSPTSGVRAGDLLSVATDGVRYGVMKVLVASADGVHIRLYVQRFARRPQASELGVLSMAPFGPDHANPFSIGHLPLSHAGFAGWEPELIERGVSVAEEELEGYQLWLEAGAGYF